MSQREILFKAKRWSDGKWVFGDLLQYQDRVSIHHYVNGCRVSDDVDPETVCQYTGLTDKNGKKIFEGDIVLLVNACNPLKAKIVWKRVEYALHGINRLVKVPLYGYQEDDIEIIGNIHDN